MNHLRLLINVGTITLALLLGTAFIMYKTGDIENLFTSATASPAGGSRMVLLLDTSEVKRRITLLDSAQRTYLQRIQRRRPPADGTSPYDSAYLVELFSTYQRINQNLIESSKSGRMVREQSSTKRMLDTIRQILIYGSTSDTNQTSDSNEQH